VHILRIARFHISTPASACVCMSIWGTIERSLDFAECGLERTGRTAAADMMGEGALKIEQIFICRYSSSTSGRELAVSVVCTLPATWTA